jgi:tRNA(fMet)-specific endonuclease VapC
MTRFCLDTSAYSHFMRGHSEVVDLIARAKWIGVPSIVLGELRTGFLLGARARENEAELAKFLSNSVVTILDADDEAARHYAEIIVALRRAGTPIPTNDAWIAAIAAREGASVLTYDAHFEAIKRVGTSILA